MRLTSAKWIWTGEQQPNTYCCMRRAFVVEQPVASATLEIAADSHYHVWLNDQRIGQGPAPSAGKCMFVDSHDVTHALRQGKNVLCVLGHYLGQPSLTYVPGTPGVVARLRIIDADGSETRVATDESWCVKEADAWDARAPRRSGAVGFSEFYDAAKEPVGWLEPEFDDSGWAAATVVKPKGRELLPRLTPELEEFFLQAKNVAAAWATGAASPKVTERPGLTAHLDEEPLRKLAAARLAAMQSAWDAGRPVVLRNMNPDAGVAVLFDLGQEWSGHVEFEIECESRGMVDFAPVELLRDGRPWGFRKGCLYANRYQARRGWQSWSTFAWHGFRYLHMVFRGFEGKVTIHRAGVRVRQAKLDLRGAFHSSDPLLNRIWCAGVHTMQIGSHEIQIDCPTREQACYWGDAVWIATWTQYLTGDLSYLRMMLLASEHIQRRDGQLMGCLFGEYPHPLFDYSLIMVWGLWEYYWRTGDRSVPRRILPVAKRVLDWYRSRRGDGPLCELNGAETQARKEGVLFIDHPGLGWHNFPHPGIDRDGVSAGLNLFMLRALDAYADMAAALGIDDESAVCREEASALRKAIHKTFWSASHGAYVDAVKDGKDEHQISQQTNAMAVLAGVCKGAKARRVLARVLAPNDESLCRCSPYFWLYMAEAMAQAGMHAELIEHERSLWGAMLDAGATSWWETFGGDEKDSLCHPWSSVPTYTLMSEVLGVKAAAPGFTSVTVAPRPDLVPEASGVVATPQGDVRVEWRRCSKARVQLEVALGDGMDGTLLLPTRKRIKRVRLGRAGVWRGEILSPQPP